MSYSKIIPIIKYKKQFILFELNPYQLSIYYCKDKPVVTDDSTLLTYIHYTEACNNLPKTKLDIQSNSSYMLFSGDYYMPKMDSVMVYADGIDFSTGNPIIEHSPYMLTTDAYITEKAREVARNFKWKYMRVLLTGELNSDKGIVITDYVQSKAQKQVEQILKEIIDAYKNTIAKIEKEQD